MSVAVVNNGTVLTTAGGGGSGNGLVSTGVSFQNNGTLTVAGARGVDLHKR